MVQQIRTADLKAMLDNQATCALIDVREPGEYNAAHIPGSSLVPRRQLEFRMHRLVPFTGTPVIAGRVPIFQVAICNMRGVQA
ncbi:rhodanese-like domain-containing protein, partial [Candidatus Entotheonella palauensis]